MVRNVNQSVAASAASAAVTSERTVSVLAEWSGGAGSAGGHRHRELNELLKNRSLRPFFVYAHNRPLGGVTSLTDYTHTHVREYARTHNTRANALARSAADDIGNIYFV